MKKIALVIGTIGGILLASCNGFLKEYPNDIAYPESVADFNELLNGEGYMDVVTGGDIGMWIHVMDDDIAFETSSENRPTVYDFYQWEPYLNTDATWKVLYKRIGILNVIINEIDEHKEGAGDEYRKVKGEAYFLRAAYYYFLVNIYGKPYHADRASTELGVPLKLTAEIEDKHYARHTVKQCYDQIETDLKAAVSHLKGLVPTSTYRGSEMAARLLLSRLDLYVGKWEEAVHQCDTIIRLGSYSLLNFNSFTPSNTLDPVYAKSPETIFSNGKSYFRSYGTPPTATSNTNAYVATSELLNLYETNDLRRTYYYRGSVKTPRKIYVTNNGSDFFMYRLPEVYLNMAEALTVLGKNSEAIDALQELRKNRFTTGNLPEINRSGEALMDFVRDERRKELSFEGQRWFDLRRYAVHPKWPLQKEIRHPYFILAEQKGELVIGKYDEDPTYYVLPIPDYEVVLSGGTLIANERREPKTPQ